MARKSKYGNQKVTVCGITFDSRREADRFLELKLLERAGEISRLTLQQKFVLIPAQYETIPRFSEKTGKRLKDGRKLIEHEMSYIADFTYCDSDGKFHVEDAKGFKTRDYIIKRKLMLWQYGVRVEEIK